MTEEAGAFATFEAKWFDAHPEIAVASIFLDTRQRSVANAFGCLAHELAEAALHLREPRVVAAKLDWWRRELVAAAAGQTRHPVTARLFADGRASALGAARWIGLADAACAVVDQAAPANREELLRQYEPLAAAIVRIEALLARGGAADGEVRSNATLWTISQLVRGLPRLAVAADALPLPLDLLARHGLTRAALDRATPERAALVRDHLDALAAALRERLAEPVPRTLYQRVRAARDAALIAAARAADEPLEILRRAAASRRWSDLWLSWREARRLAREG